MFDKVIRRKSNKFVRYSGSLKDESLLHLASSFNNSSDDSKFLYFTCEIFGKLSILLLDHENGIFDVGVVVDPTSLMKNCAVIQRRNAEGKTSEHTFELVQANLQLLIDVINSIHQNANSDSFDYTENNLTNLNDSASSNVEHPSANHPSLNWSTERPDVALYSEMTLLDGFTPIKGVNDGDIVNNSLAYYADVRQSPNLQSSHFLGLIIRFLDSYNEDSTFITSSLLPNVGFDQLYGGDYIYVNKMGDSLFSKLLKPISPLPKGSSVTGWSSMLRFTIGGQSVLQWVLDGLWTSCFKMSQLFLVVDDMDNFIASFIASCYINAIKVTHLSGGKKVRAASSNEFHLSFNLSNTTFSRYFVTYAFINGVLSPLGRSLNENGLLCVFKRGGSNTHCVIASGPNTDLTVLFDSWPGLLNKHVTLDYRCDVVVLRQQGTARDFGWLHGTFNDVIAGWKSEYALASVKFDFWDHKSMNQTPISSKPLPQHLIAGGDGSLDVVLGDLVSGFVTARSYLNSAATVFAAATVPIYSRLPRMMWSKGATKTSAVIGATGWMLNSASLLYLFNKKV